MLKTASAQQEIDRHVREILGRLHAHDNR